MTHGSLFSGVGGFDLGFDAAGFTTLWQVEKNAQCRSVLERHWPKAARYENVESVNGYDLKPVDVISFGSPCQDLSVAGKQKGLKGSQSKLFFEATRIIQEMKEATNGQYPKVCIWENVKGALSSNEGKDFRKVISTLAKLGAVDIEWRVLNTSDFGPPQRRERVFVVVRLGDIRPGSVLAQPTRVLWHPSTSREAGEEVAGETGDSASSDRWRTTGSRANTLTANDGAGPDLKHADANHLVYAPKTSTTLTTKCGVTFDDAQVAQLTVLKVYAYDGYNQKLEHGQPHRTLRVGRDSSDFIAIPENPPTESYKIRRLTPRECERLQGWPDDHTLTGHDGKEISNSARYKMIGNGISAPVAQWIGENLQPLLRPVRKRPQRAQ